MKLTLTTEEPYDELHKLFATELRRTHTRSTTIIENIGGNAVFTVTAQDVASLRAATNAITSVLGMYEKTASHHGN